MEPQEGGFPLGGVKVRPVPCVVHGKRKYRLELEGANDNICGLDALAEDIQLAGLNLHVSAVENILNTLMDVLPKFMARTGRAVRIGNIVTLKLCATGTLDYANDSLDPDENRLEIRATVSPALRHALDKAQLVNVEHRRKGIDFVILDANGGRRGEIDAKHNIHVNGRDIYVPKQEAADDGARGRVWVETMDGRLLGRCAVLSSGPGLIVARFKPEGPVSVAEGRLVVETYGTRSAAEARDETLLARYTCDVRFR